MEDQNEVYEAPAAEVIVFDGQDIIVASGGFLDPNETEIL